MYIEDTECLILDLCVEKSDVQGFSEQSSAPVLLQGVVSLLVQDNRDAFSLGMLAHSLSVLPEKKKSPKPLLIRPLSAHLAPEFPVCILTVCLGFMGLHIPGGRKTPEDTCVYKPAMKAFLFWQSITKLKMRKDRRQKLRPSVENCNSESSQI